MSGWLLKVRVTPRSSRNEVESWDGETLHVRVTAPPAEGQANEACRELLAKALRLPKSKVILVQGAHHRDKVFRIMQGEPALLNHLANQ